MPDGAIASPGSREQSGRVNRAFALLVLLMHVACASASALGPDGAGPYLPGKFVWIDLATEDPARAREFYGAVFGWTFREAGGYTLIEAQGRSGLHA